ncbi:hypothetical protein RF11_05726 [Thelohanellus kitauei]|uniref:Reverse transcriptase RNase H-like domain-containing protein n=1 Tax=Thelohanellus kitauei TaxID=669202 RepID=A0A0C2JPK9_THEKT|nr:hypothetical protein RF11_05726 [Thelohanellus kitauei]
MTYDIRRSSKQAQQAFFIPKPKPCETFHRFHLDYVKLYDALFSECSEKCFILQFMICIRNVNIKIEMPVSEQDTCLPTKHKAINDCSETQKLTEPPNPAGVSLAVGKATFQDSAHNLMLVTIPAHKCIRVYQQTSPSVEICLRKNRRPLTNVDEPRLQLECYVFGFQGPSLLPTTSLTSQTPIGEFDEIDKIIPFTLRTLSQTERKYPVTILELLSNISTLNMFRTYLLGRCIIIGTDHQPLNNLQQQR